MIVRQIDRIEQRSTTYKNIMITEILEASSVLIGLDCWQSWTIFAEDDSFPHALALLVQGPLLEEVDDGDMIDSLAIRLEAVLFWHLFCHIDKLNLLSQLFMVNYGISNDWLSARTNLMNIVSLPFCEGLDSKKKRIVHQTETLKKIDIFSDDLFHFDPSLIIQTDEVFRGLCCNDKVYILQSCGSSCLSFCFAVNKTTFQVEDEV